MKVNIGQWDDPRELKDYRVSYFKDDRLIYSYIFRKDTEAFTVMCAAFNTGEDVHCQVEEVDGALVWDQRGPPITF